MSIKLQMAETSHRDWVWQFEIDDEDTGEPIDLTDATIAIAINDADGCQLILASTGNGKIVVVDTGVVQMTIPYSETGLCAGSYDIGGYYQLNGDTPDLFEGSVSVRKGIPTP